MRAAQRRNRDGPVADDGAILSAALIDRPFAVDAPRSLEAKHAAPDGAVRLRAGLSPLRRVDAL